MKYVKLAVILSLAFPLLGCQFFSNINADPHLRDTNNLTPLIRYHLDDGIIFITAVSKGCTLFNSYEVRVANPEQNSIAVVQVKPDLCALTSRSVELQYSFKHLSLDFDKPILVVNPVEEG
ncbi:hypothetical protein [Aliikangiella sp. IMCC44359]|uniref:hypothetical protein n=1 Tax=Aliikangiella sp. IMCC44359 TaxID=3459125 RepID=UPI00403A9188